MKKKAFAVFAAALTALCCLAAPSAAAESQYQMGDVNRDGMVSLLDAQWALTEYVQVTLGRQPVGTVLDDEQRKLAMVADRESLITDREYAEDHVVIMDCGVILAYFCRVTMCHVPKYEGMDVVEFGKDTSWRKSLTYGDTYLS